MARVTRTGIARNYSMAHDADELLHILGHKRDHGAILSDLVRKEYDRRQERQQEIEAWKKDHGQE